MQPPDETLWDKVPFLNTLIGKGPQARIILIDSSGNAIRLKGLPQNIAVPKAKTFAATGKFDSCSQTIILSDPSAVEDVSD